MINTKNNTPVLIDPFKKVLPLRTRYLNKLPKRYRINGKFYEIQTDNIYKKHIYKAIFSALQSDWYEGISKYYKRTINTVLVKFIPWLNELDVNRENQYSILKNYESFQMNVCNLKPQSAGVTLIMNLLEKGIFSENGDEKMLVYLDALLKNTTLSPSQPICQDTLSSYFGSLPWLKESLGDRDWFKLESPKRLTNSFSITIATTLLFVMKQKAIARSLLGTDILGQVSKKVDLKKDPLKKYCREIYLKTCEFDAKGNPITDLTGLVALDLIYSDKLDLFINNIVLANKSDLQIKVNRINVFSQPDLFATTSWDFPSKIEQVLFSWLCAWMTIQPFDIPKLKHGNFIITKNSKGRAVTLQCNYYKGRSGRKIQPFMVEARQIEAQAILAYLRQFKEPEDQLFSSGFQRYHNLTFGKCSITERLALLFRLPSIGKEVKKNLKAREASALFLRAYEALYEKKDFVFSTWFNVKKRLGDSDRSYADYCKDSRYIFSSSLFGLSHIKTSSIHSRSDLYRDGDLVNQNSHSSAVEKSSYLNDSNKMWVNQNQRITRMVLDDIETHVYQPSIEKVAAAASDLKLRTRVIESTELSSSDSRKCIINTDGKATLSFDVIGGDYDDILVLDTPETVVNMLHYIEEAKGKKNILVASALPFFELTVLPNVEWMESLLINELEASVVKEGKLQYEEIRKVLPSLFESELRGGVS